MNIEKKIKVGILAIITIILTVIGCFVFLERIENGYVGVRYSMNGGIKDTTLDTGVKFVGLDKVTQYPIRLQVIKAKDITFSTNDGKKTTVDIKYDYKIDPAKVSKIFKEFGNITSEDIEGGWLRSKLQKEAREVYAHYSLLEILSGKSSTIETELLDAFKEAVEGKGFLVESVTIGVPEVDAETQKSIDAAFLARQENEKAKIESETARTKAETESEVAKTKADSEAYKVEKAAEAQADANSKLNNSITDNLIKYKEAEAREKHGWVTVNGADTVVTDGDGK